MGEAASQAAWRAEMETERLGLLKDGEDGEGLRTNMLADGDAKTREEDLCGKAAEDYGVAEGKRLEDLENLVKLKSLLRMLYFKKKPLDCSRNEDTKAVCSGKDRGWCVFVDKHPKTEQRCSCNRGFYGKACQYVMCPGIAQNLYPHDAATGVCSNQAGKETRGTCNKMTGLCTCNDEVESTRRFYHGPKRGCEFARAPPSKSGEVDNKCSERGRSFQNKADPENVVTYSDGYDKVRGNCHCMIEFWGPGCEFKKCPGGAKLSAGGAVLYQVPHQMRVLAAVLAPMTMARALAHGHSEALSVSSRTALATAVPRANLLARVTQESACARTPPGDTNASTSHAQLTATVLAENATATTANVSAKWATLVKHASRPRGALPKPVCTRSQ